MANNSSSQKMSFQAGEAKGRTQEKANNLVDRAANTTQSARESIQEAGQQMKAKAQGATEAIKDFTGMNKN